MSLAMKIKAEVFTHVGACVYPYAKNALALCEEISVDDELKKHNIEVLKKLEGKTKSLDLAIVDSFRADMVTPIYAHLKDDGILIMASALWENEEIKEQLKSLDLFRFCIPFRFCDYDGNSVGAIFASKKYHPKAHIRLHIADMLDGLTYYNADLHHSFFAMPTFVYEDLKSFLKL